jgi:hypothetical protein
LDGVWLALSTLLTAVIVTGGALLTIWLNGKQLRAGKAQDYARQDQVAAALAQRQDVAEAKAAEVAAKAAEAAELLLAANERVAHQSAEAAQVTNGKLAQIHDLVNSNMTIQMEETHGALAQQLVLMREVINMHRAAGRPPSRDALQAIEVLGRRVGELQAQLSDRAKVTEAADAKLTQPGS